MTEQARKKMVLVIDDSQTICMLLSRALAEQGYNCVTASSIEDAIRITGSSKVDLLITDLIMPGIGGLAGIPVIRSNFEDLPIIAMSAGTGEAAAKTVLTAARQVGADAVFQKPFQTDAMMDKVGELLGSATPNQHKVRVLVVDDSSTIRQIVAKFLEDPIFQVHTAASMEDALDTWDIVGVDLVISDIFMPGMGGIEGITRIKQNWPDVKVIAISGGWVVMSKEKALAAAASVGADMTLRKPFEQSELLSVIEQVMTQDAQNA